MHRIVWGMALWLLAHAAAGDVLELRDGRTLEGRFRGATQQSLRFETREGVQVVPIARAVALTFSAQSAGAPGAPTSPPATTPPSPQPGTTATKPGEANPATRPHASAASDPTTNAAPPPIAETAGETTRSVQLPAGTRLRVRVSDTIDPRQSTEGDRFSATLEVPLLIDDWTLAPERSPVYGVVSAARTTGPLAHQLRLELTELQIRGQTFAIVTGNYQRVELPAEAEAPAKAAPESARVPNGALLEFRLLQPLEIRVQSR